MAKKDTDDLSSQFRELSVNKDDINILLLGETGVGKSTFINSFTNYLHYETLDLAEKDELKCLIPAKFEIRIENENKQLEKKIISIGEDKNENTNIFSAATQCVRSYVFAIPDYNNRIVRLIDTPGICDDRGIEQDKINLENILSYLGKIEMLHGICLLLKPNNARLTPTVEYCITQLLSRLEKSAGENIMFVFTNSRGSFYKPQDSSVAINALLEKIKKNPPHVEIKFEVDNTFCLDNEGFRYVAALKQGHDMGYKSCNRESWKRSQQECHRLIKFVIGEGPRKLTPHEVSRTISVNKARQVILELSKPLADVTELINDNLNALENHEKALNQDNLSLKALTDQLYVPVIDLEEIECQQPKTVCFAGKCCEKIAVGNITKTHYTQRCHDPCFLTNVARENVGDAGLKHCAAMDRNGKCKHCGCDFSIHLHIYYETRTVNGRIEGAGIRSQILNMESAVMMKRDTIRKIEQNKNEYEREKATIIKGMAKFAHFLERNAISPFNDSYKAYIEVLINRENSRGPDCCLQTVESLRSMLKQYDQEKKILQDALKVRSANLKVEEITPDKILKEIKQLYALPKMGPKIKNMHEMQKRGEAIEHKNTEFVLPHSSKLGFKSNNSNNQRGKGKGSNRVNMINEDKKKFKNKKQENYSKGKMQNMGRNYQKQNNQMNQMNQPNQMNQKGNYQNNQSNQNRSYQNPNNQNKNNQNPNNQNKNHQNTNQRGVNQPPNIPQLMNLNLPYGAPNFQNPQMFPNFPMNPQGFNMGFNYPQFNYQNIPPNAYHPSMNHPSMNPSMNHPSMHPSNHPMNPPYPPNQNYPNYGYPPPNIQEKNQNTPMNNTMKSQQNKNIHVDHYEELYSKDKNTYKSEKNVESLYEELYSMDKSKYEKSNNERSKNERSTSYRTGIHEESDSDNESAAGFDRFRREKGQQNYADLYGDDDDDNNQNQGKISGLFSSMKSIFK